MPAPRPFRPTRRRLLQGLGAAAALPLLGRLPAAHAATPPKRLVVFCSPNEPIDRAHWEPGPNLALNPVMSALEPHKAKLLLLGGMKVGPGDADPHSGHYCMGQLLTGRTNTYYGSMKSQFWGSGISLDQYLAQALGTPALTLGAKCGRLAGIARMSYAGPSQPVHPLEDPAKAFAQVFGSTTLSPDAVAVRQAQRQSVLDVVAADLRQLQAGLPSADRPKLERHLDAVRELELRLTAPAQTSCSPTPLPGGIDPLSDVDFPLTARRQMDVLVQALACDLTRVGSLQLGNSASSGTPTWPTEGVNHAVSEHDIAHEYYSVNSTTAVARRRDVESVYYRLFAYLLEKLDAIQEGTGTLLDSTLVLWMKPMAKGHGHRDMLFMLAGSAQGQLQTGRYLQFPGVSHNHLLLSVCHLMGQTQLTHFGDPAFCTGPLAL